MRTAAGLHADDPVGRERFAAHQELHVFAGEDVVGHHAELIAVAHPLAQRVDQRGLPGSDRPADPEANSRTAHDRNNRECTYCWLIAAMSSSGVKHRGGAASCAIRSTHAGTRAQHVGQQTRALRADRSPSAASRQNRRGQPRVAVRLDRLRQRHVRRRADDAERHGKRAARLDSRAQLARSPVGLICCQVFSSRVPWSASPRGPPTRVASRRPRRIEAVEGRAIA